MLNFLDELEHQGCAHVPEAVTDSADMAWVAYTSPETKAFENRTHIPLTISPDRFIRSMFIDPSRLENPTKLMTELHTVASDMQDVELKALFLRPVYGGRVRGDLSTEQYEDAPL